VLRGPRPQPRPAGPAEGERDVERARAPVEEREVEAVQVVVLDDVGIRVAHPRHQAPDEVRLGGRVVARRLEHLGAAAVVAHRHHEDAVAPGVEPVVSRSNCRRCSASNGRSRK
jgi:hypothetical protein